MTDIEIAENSKLKPIKEIAKKLGLVQNDITCYGNYIAKINSVKDTRKGKLILVTSINPTKAGEGKTTVAIGLADALQNLNKKTCLALREPSLGPVFGLKGGATGGGQSQIAPMIDINLHFTGDFHAVTSANNLLCALIDNHIYQGNELKLDTSNIFFRRCLDLNDRELRNINLKGRKESFTITAASEIMAILSMSTDLEDLKQRLGKIFVGLNLDGKPVLAKDLKAQDSMAILLKDALKPNLAQTLNNTPAIVHCGPFANIAHGCNSVVATETACSLADYVVTEAGFGADLGAEKFLDFKCRETGLKPNCIVIVITLKALKLHGGGLLASKSPNDALKLGLENLYKHIDTIKNVFKLPYVVTLNKYSSDDKKEIAFLKEILKDDLTVNDVWSKGKNGGKELALKVIEKSNQSNESFAFAYDLNDSIEEKINCIARKIYGSLGAKFSETAKQKIAMYNKLSFDKLPIIIAKTQYSLSCDEKLIGRPKNFYIEVEDLQLKNGAGFIVAVCGNIMLMPGLSKKPAALSMNIDNKGKISGLF